MIATAPLRRDKLVSRDFDCRDEQRHRDREHSVAERFDTHRLTFFFHVRYDRSPLQ